MNPLLVGASLDRDALGTLASALALLLSQGSRPANAWASFSILTARLTGARAHFPTLPRPSYNFGEVVSMIARLRFYDRLANGD